MANKSQKNTPQGSPQMARPGEHLVFSQYDTPQKKLKAPRGRIFGIMAESKAIWGVFAGKLLILKICAKRWFKRHVKGGLKKITERGQRSLPCFLKNSGKGRFTHVKMV